MKKFLNEVHKVVSSLLREGVCPACGDKRAYIGMRDVECPNVQCPNFSMKQLQDVDPSVGSDVAKYKASGGKFTIDGETIIAKVTSISPENMADGRDSGDAIFSFEGVFTTPKRKYPYANVYPNGEVIFTDSAQSESFYSDELFDYLSAEGSKRAP